MIKSIWEKIKLAFERKPAGEIIIPEHETISVVVPQPEVVKVKRVYKRKPKNEST